MARKLRLDLKFFRYSSPLKNFRSIFFESKTLMCVNSTPTNRLMVIFTPGGVVSDLSAIKNRIQRPLVFFGHYRIFLTFCSSFFRQVSKKWPKTLNLVKNRLFFELSTCHFLIIVFHFLCFTNVFVETIARDYFRFITFHYVKFFKNGRKVKIRPCVNLRPFLNIFTFIKVRIRKMFWGIVSVDTLIKKKEWKYYQENCLAGTRGIANFWPNFNFAAIFWTLSRVKKWQIEKRLSWRSL